MGVQYTPSVSDGPLDAISCTENTRRCGFQGQFHVAVPSSGLVWRLLYRKGEWGVLITATRFKEVWLGKLQLSLHIRTINPPVAPPVRPAASRQLTFYGEGCRVVAFTTADVPE